MGMYSASSDRDYADACHGPYGESVSLTCVTCKGVVWVSRSEEPPGPVLCDRCDYEQTIQRQEQEQLARHQ